MAGIFDALNMGLQGFGAGRQRLQEQQRQQQQAALEQQRYDQERTDLLGYRQQTRADQAIRDRTDEAQYWHGVGLKKEQHDADQARLRAKDAIDMAPLAPVSESEAVRFRAAYPNFTGPVTRGIYDQFALMPQDPSKVFGPQRPAPMDPNASIGMRGPVNPRQAPAMDNDGLGAQTRSSMIANMRTWGFDIADDITDALLARLWERAILSRPVKGADGAIYNPVTGEQITPPGAPGVGGDVAPGMPGAPGAIMGGRGSGPLYNLNYMPFEASSLAPPPMGPAAGRTSGPTMPNGPTMPVMSTLGRGPSVRPMLDVPEMAGTRVAPDMGMPDLPAPPMAPLSYPQPDRRLVAKGVQDFIAQYFEPAGKDDASRATIGGQPFVALDLAKGMPLKVKASITGARRAALTQQLIEGRNYLVETAGGQPGEVPASWMDAAMPPMPILGPKPPTAALAMQGAPSVDTMPQAPMLPTSGAPQFSPPAGMAPIARPAMPGAPMLDARAMSDTFDAPPVPAMPNAPTAPTYDGSSVRNGVDTSLPALRPPDNRQVPMWQMMQDPAAYLDVPAMQEQIISLAASGRLVFSPSGVDMLLGPGGDERTTFVANDLKNPDSAKAIAMVRRIVGDNAFDADGMAMVDPTRVPKGQASLYTAFYKGREREHTFFDPKTGTMVKTEPMTDADAKLYAQQMGLEYRYGSSPTAQANIALTQAKTADIPIDNQLERDALDVRVAENTRRYGLNLKQYESGERYKGATLEIRRAELALGRERIRHAARVGASNAARADARLAQTQMGMQLRAIDDARNAIYQRAKQVTNADKTGYDWEFAPGDKETLAKLDTVYKQYIPALNVDLDETPTPPPFAGSGGGGGSGPALATPPPPSSGGGGMATGPGYRGPSGGGPVTGPPAAAADPPAKKPNPSAVDFGMPSLPTRKVGYGLNSGGTGPGYTGFGLNATGAKPTRDPQPVDTTKNPFAMVKPTVAPGFAPGFAPAKPAAPAAPKPVVQTDELDHTGRINVTNNLANFANSGGVAGDAASWKTKNPQSIAHTLRYGAWMIEQQGLKGDDVRAELFKALTRPMKFGAKGSEAYMGDRPGYRQAVSGVWYIPLDTWTVQAIDAIIGAKPNVSQTELHDAAVNYYLDGYFKLGITDGTELSKVVRNSLAQKYGVKV